MNISEIWEFSNEQLQTILTTKNQRLSEDKNFDQTVVATILYNDGKLDAESMLLVENPKFNEIMGETSDHTYDIFRLTNQLPVITLQNKETISNSKEFKALFTDYFDELELSDIVFEARNIGINLVSK